MIRTKIIATMGPAVADEKTLYSIFEAGVDICRLNFSHGSLDEHAVMLRTIRETAKRFPHPIAVLGDLCGPKIRVGKVADTAGTGGMPVNVGDVVTVQRAAIVGKDLRISTILETFVDDVQVGHRVLIEDGMLRFVCTEKSADELKISCTMGGIIKSSKGINLPNTHINTPSITDRDFECADWAIANDIDYLALSFVRSADDIRLLRGHLQYKKATEVQIISKIEMPQAIADIDAIIEASDGLMVARGDLGVEMDVAEVPIIQKDLCRRCQRAGKPVIVATQMLQSMIEQASPTRAEVSDVANAIFDGADALMMSAETSVGKFPVGTVLTMAHVAETTEAYIAGHLSPNTAPPIVEGDPDAQALARGAYRIAHDAKVKLIIIWSQRGKTAQLFSKHHFSAPIIAISSDIRMLRRMAINFGVSPHELPRYTNINDLIAAVDRLVLEDKYAAEGDKVLIVAGWTAAMPDTMNSLILHTIGERWTPLSPAITDRL